MSRSCRVRARKGPQERRNVMKLDRVREKLAEGRLCFGTHCSTTEPWYYEMCGFLDYDYVWIDNEHAGMTMPMIQNAIVATNAGGCAAFVRVQDHEMENVKPVLEAGVDGVIFPMVNTAEEAEHCVSICTYPPRGTRGFGPLRAIEYGNMPLDDYLAQVDGSILKLLQCEHVRSVENLDEILEVEGVGGVICGPMDLSASVGKLGKLTDPEVVGLMQSIIDKCKARRVPFGVSIGLNFDLVEFWIAQGASFVSMGTPADYFWAMSKDVTAKARRLEAAR